MSGSHNLQHSNISLLYIEDEPATRELIARFLASRGYKLTVAENGQEGLNRYREQMPDITLTDIMMPKMNGLEMSREIRKINPEAQIICMTAFSEVNYLIEAIDIGINQFVLKPVEFSRLLPALNRCHEMINLRKRHLILEAEHQRTKKLEAISVLAGGIAHDFNNLLQVILGYVSLARMSAEPGSKTETLLRSAENTSDTARQLGKRLLTFAKGGDSAMTTTDLPPLFEEELSSELGGSEVTYTTEFPDDLPPITLDVGQFRLVVDHLAVNAREALPPGGCLNVSATKLTLPESNEFALTPGEYVHIIFRDNGRGIAPENLPRIFDPYFTTKQMGCQKGMGLGLALSYSIIRHHSGQILAESKPDQGTSIHIYLPLDAPRSRMTIG